MIPSRIAVAVALGLAAVGCGSAVRPAREVPARSVAARSHIVVPEPRPVSLSTSPPTAPIKPLAGETVVIDPGHNGHNYLHPGIINSLVPAGRGQVKACDTTGTSTDAGYSEAAFNFDMALRLKRLLVAQGARVVLTRRSNTGVGPCVNVRAAIGNAARADAVIAIHADGGPPGGRGSRSSMPRTSVPPLAPTALRCGSREMSITRSWRPGCFRRQPTSRRTATAFATIWPGSISQRAPRYSSSWETCATARTRRFR